MSGLFEEFEAELKVLRTHFRGRPKEELIHLGLLAVEREQMVSVSYREDVILDRIAKLRAPAAIKELVHHAILWIWKHEEMHMVYLRGMLLRHGSMSLCLKAYFHQFQGAIGGWAGAVRQHGSWTTAPLSQAVAGTLTGLGILAGKVPRAVRGHLRQASFREFCLFNIDAERTAAACFVRMKELAETHPELSDDQGRAFQAILGDEFTHEQVFQTFAEAFDDAGALRPGQTAEAMEERLREIGEPFLPLHLRSGSPELAPAGHGGTVWVRTGTPETEAVPEFRKLLETSDFASRVVSHAKALGKSVGELSLVIKPTFMLGYHQKDRSPITDPALVEELARFLRSLGVNEIAVVESPNHYDWYFENRTVAQVARYLGFVSDQYRLVDLSSDQVEFQYRRGMAVSTVSRTWKDADMRLSFAKLRSHPCEHFYLSTANVSGVGMRIDQFLFSERQAQRETAVVIPLVAFPVHYSFLDAWGPTPDGLVGVMGSPFPKFPRRFYGGADLLAVDAVAARHLGNDPRNSAILRTAFQWIGDPRNQLQVEGNDEVIPDWIGPHATEFSTLLSLLAFPVYEFASARGALFAPEMDAEAFPPLGGEGFWKRLTRRTIRKLIGIQHPAGSLAATSEKG